MNHLADWEGLVYLQKTEAESAVLMNAKDGTEAMELKRCPAPFAPASGSSTVEHLPKDWNAFLNGKWILSSSWSSGPRACDKPSLEIKPGEFSQLQYGTLDRVMKDTRPINEIKQGGARALYLDLGAGQNESGERIKPKPQTLEVISSDRLVLEPADESAQHRYYLRCPDT